MIDRITRPFHVSRSDSSETSIFRDRRTVIVGASLLAFLIFLSTLQLEINGSAHPYATDVGEIQNALPRWGTVHFTGYPLYTALGSLFVNGLQLVGISPAVAAGLYSAFWGAVSIGLLAWLMLLFDVPVVAAMVASLLFALSTSMWVDASLAELHTMTMALTFGALLVGVRFYRSGRAVYLYWLAFLAGQGVAHQRAFAFLAPALALLVLPHWRLLRWRWAPVLGLALLGPLTYLYLPLVDWLGSDWVFSAPGTWEGFWALILDTKADRIVSIPESSAALWARVSGVVSLLNNDWPWPLWATGLVGLMLLGRARWVERAALAAAWLSYLLLSVIIWEGSVSDALLAVKLPVIAMAAIGLGFLAQSFSGQRTKSWLTVLAGIIVLLFLFVVHRPNVLAITRDPGAEQTITLVERLVPPADGRPATLMALWGNDYWQLVYAQRYQDQFPWLNLVDHNANFQAIVDVGDHLYTLSRTFYARPVGWWEEKLGRPVSLDAVAPGVVEVRPAPAIASAEEPPLLTLENGVAIRNAALAWEDNRTLHLSVTWHAQREVAADYSVAVHLVRTNPPAGPDDILAQADRAHPVDGWYPTTRWRPGEVVHDHFLLTAEPGTTPVAVRVSMYRQVDEGFENTAWLDIPVPSQE